MWKRCDVFLWGWHSRLGRLDPVTSLYILCLPQGWDVHFMHYVCFRSQYWFSHCVLSALPWIINAIHISYSMSLICRASIWMLLKVTPVAISADNKIIHGADITFMKQTYRVQDLSWQLSSNGPHLWGAPVSQRLTGKLQHLRKPKC